MMAIKASTGVKERGLKRRAFAIGYWENSTVPDLSNLLDPIGVNQQTFSSWLGSQLANIRGAAEVRRQLPTTGDEREWAELFLNHVRQLRRAMSGGSMPPRTAAHLHAALMHMGMKPGEVEERLHDDLIRLEVGVARALQKIPPTALKAGRPSTLERDTLLAATAARLLVDCGGKKELARKVAREVLERCGFRFPGTASEQASTTRKAASRGKKSL